MAIITLTTDMGLSDFYVAAVKGQILSELPRATIVDITHAIKHFNVVQAAYTLKNTYPYFPKGTIHIVSVDELESDQKEHVALLYKGQYFIGANNGLFSIIFDNMPEEMVALKQPEPDNSWGTFPTLGIFAKAACGLAKGDRLSDIGYRKVSPKIAFTQRPFYDTDSIRGSIIHIDHYCNAITNIHQEEFEKVRKGRNFLIKFSKNYMVSKIHSSYNQVPSGEAVALFNSGKLLEIAINEGYASKLMGLSPEQVIRIDFS